MAAVSKDYFVSIIMGNLLSIHAQKHMSNYPTISLITPSLNQAEFIEETIRSVLSQEYPNLEYFVMDGGSTDGTLEILEKYGDKLKWISEQDQGQTHAINKGLQMTSGPIVGFLNADDLLTPGALWKVAKAFSEHQDTKWFIGQCRIIDEKSLEIRRPITIYKNIFLHIRSFPLLLMTNYISQPATFWSRDALNELGMMDESLHYVMDYEYWLRLYAKYIPVFIPEYLASFRIQNKSKTTTKGHGTIYINEERNVIRRYTKSRFFIFLHNAHRYIMTLVYSIINYDGKIPVDYRKIAGN